MHYLEPDPPPRPWWNRRLSLCAVVAVLALLIGLPAFGLTYDQGFWLHRGLYWVSPDDRVPSLAKLCSIRRDFDGPELAHALESEKPMLRTTAAWIVLRRGDIRALDVFVAHYARWGREHVKLDPGRAIEEAFEGTIAVPGPDEVEAWWSERRGSARYVDDGHWRMR